MARIGGHWLDFVAVFTRPPGDLLTQAGTASGGAVALGIFTIVGSKALVAPIGRTSPNGPPSSGSASSHLTSPSNIVPCVVLASSVLQRLGRRPRRCAVRSADEMCSRHGSNGRYDIRK